MRKLHSATDLGQGEGLNISGWGRCSCGGSPAARLKLLTEMGDQWQVFPCIRSCGSGRASAWKSHMFAAPSSAAAAWEMGWAPLHCSTAAAVRAVGLAAAEKPRCWAAWLASKLGYRGWDQRPLWIKPQLLGMIWGGERIFSVGQ